MVFSLHIVSQFLPSFSQLGVTKSTAVIPQFNSDISCKNTFYIPLLQFIKMFSLVLQNFYDVINTNITATTILKTKRTIE